MKSSADTGTARPTEAAEPLALYVHWPYCLAKCPYCDFNSHVAAAIDHAVWARAYLEEIERVAAELPGRRLVSIFFGGGTPSLMDPATVQAVIDAARAAWPAGGPKTGPETGPPEITLEANPTSVERGRLRDFAEAGINRISIGLQSLDDSSLKFLGREHSAVEAMAALETAMGTFPRVNADLIYARPGQTVGGWLEELNRVTELGLGHLSLYQLTIERGTPFFAAHRRGAFRLPEEETAARMYEETNRALADAGLCAYEISNHARPDEACRHNLAYWRSEDYAGIGPGAHGRLTVGGQFVAVEAIRNPDRWLTAVAARDGSQEKRRIVPPAERAEEALMMGLRLEEGVEESRFRQITGTGFADALARDRLRRLVDGGFLNLERGRLTATTEGRLRLDAVLSELLA